MDVSGVTCQQLQLMRGNRALRVVLHSPAYGRLVVGGATRVAMDWQEYCGYYCCDMSSDAREVSIHHQGLAPDSFHATSMLRAMFADKILFQAAESPLALKSLVKSRSVLVLAENSMSRRVSNAS